MLRPKTVILTPVDVDPRSWFSNERTCIEWLHSAGILGAFASGLIASGDSAMRFAGMSLLIPALTVVVHAKRQHSERSKQLDDRAVSSHFDLVGPTLLTFFISLTLLANLAIAIAHQLYSERQYNATPNEMPTLYWPCAVVLTICGSAMVTLPPRVRTLGTGNALGLAPLAQPLVENEAGAEPHRTVGRGVMRPKLLYANERTFIHWSHICSLVASTAMAVTSSPKARLLTGSNAVNWLWAGGLLSAVAISLLGYAHHIYFWRARAILQSSEKRCDDPLGPLMLSCTLLVAITAGALAILLPENQ